MWKAALFLPASPERFLNPVHPKQSDFAARNLPRSLLPVLVSLSNSVHWKIAPESDGDPHPERIPKERGLSIRNAQEESRFRHPEAGTTGTLRAQRKRSNRFEN